VAVVRSAQASDSSNQGASKAPLPGRPEEEVVLVTNRMRMRPFSRQEAEAYVRLEGPIDCAGAYKAEGLGIALFEHLRGDDPTAIVGLPLVALINLLRRFGLDPLINRQGD